MALKPYQHLILCCAENSWTKAIKNISFFELPLVHLQTEYRVSNIIFVFSLLLNWISIFILVWWAVTLNCKCEWECAGLFVSICPPCHSWINRVEIKTTFISKPPNCRESIHRQWGKLNYCIYTLGVEHTSVWNAKTTVTIETIENNWGGWQNKAILSAQGHDAFLLVLMDSNPNDTANTKVFY